MGKLKHADRSGLMKTFKLCNVPMDKQVNFFSKTMPHGKYDENKMYE